MPAAQRGVGAQLRARAAASTFAPQRCASAESCSHARRLLQMLKAPEPHRAQLLHEGHKLVMVSKHCTCRELSFSASCAFPWQVGWKEDVIKM